MPGMARFVARKHVQQTICSLAISSPQHGHVMCISVDLVNERMRIVTSHGTHGMPECDQDMPKHARISLAVRRNR